MNEWVSVKERMPAPKVTVLVVRGVGKQRRVDMCCCGNTRNEHWWSITQNAQVPAWSVTHWQPLPEMPKEEAE